MRNTRQSTIIVCILVFVLLAGNLSGCSLPESESIGCSLPESEPIIALEGVWAKPMPFGHFTILTINEGELRAFYVKTEQPITEETAAALLEGNLAYFYSYSKNEGILALTELDKGTEAIEFNMTLSDGLLVLKSNNDVLLLNGQYTYIAPPVDGISAKKANDMLTQEFMNNTWIQNRNEGQGYYGYTILSINPLSYSNILFINTTLNLDNGTFQTDLGFRCEIVNDSNRADTFFNFIVQDNRSMKIEWADSELPSPYVPEGIYTIVLTNKGIFVSSREVGTAQVSGFKMDGYYYSPEIDTASLEGIWVSPLDDYQLDGLSRYYFDTIIGGKITSSRMVFAEGDVVDHSKLQEYYKQSGDKMTIPYHMFEGGQLKFAGVCLWPVYVTDELCIVGVSGAPNDLPKYWVSKYRLG